MSLRLFVLPLLFVGACAPSHGYVSATYAPDVYAPPPPVFHEHVYVVPRYDAWGPRPHPPHHHHREHHHHHPRVERAPPAYRPAQPYSHGPHRAPPASRTPRGHGAPH